MNALSQHSSPAISVIIWGVVAVALIVRFSVRELRERKVRLRWIFVGPAILCVVALAALGVAVVLAGRELIVLAIAVAAAIAVGWLAGLGVSRYTTLRLPAEPGLVYVRGSYATLAIWLGAVALRLSARLAVGTRDAAALVVANAALVVFLAVATTCVRYHLLAGVRAARAWKRRNRSRRSTLCKRMPFRIDHVDARVPSLIAVERFYSELLPALGAVERRYARVDLRGWTYVEPHERYNTIEFVAAGAPGRPFFGVIEESGVPPSRSRIAFGVDSPEEVARIAELLPSIGARTIERSDLGEGSGYHAVFFEDPLGSRLEVVHRS